jgi:membrane dipeptidase
MRHEAGESVHRTPAWSGLVIPVVDGHNDALLRAWRRSISLRERSEEGHLDLPRMTEGGIVAGFFAIFVPGSDIERADPREGLVHTADGYELPLEEAVPLERASYVAGELAAIAESDLELVLDVAHLAACVAGERGPGAILHLEGAEPLDPGLGNLEAWVDRGVRSIGIVWSRPNAFGCGVPFRFPGNPDTGPGLTRPGRELVRACNRLGVAVDLAHLNKAGFRDVARISDAPLIVSHTASHALCPITRNLTDAQLALVRESGGVVGILFDTAMTRADASLVPDTPLDVIAGHIEHVVELIGVDYVALGSDFDGARPPVPLADAARTQTLLEFLRERGWSNDELERLANRNWLRVLESTWRW